MSTVAEDTTARGSHGVDQREGCPGDGGVVGHQPRRGGGAQGGGGPRLRDRATPGEAGRPRSGGPADPRARRDRRGVDGGGGAGGGGRARRGGRLGEQRRLHAVWGIGGGGSKRRARRVRGQRV